MIDETAYKGLTCLHLAAIKGHTTIAKQLLATRFDLILETDELGRLPLDLAVKYQRKEIVALLVESVQSDSDESYAESMFRHAAKKGYEQIVSQLLTWKPSLMDTVDQNGYNALQLAAQNDRHTTARLLLAASTSDEVGGNYSMSLLHFAAQYGYDTVSARLIVEKPHLMDITNDNPNVLGLAARGGYDKIVAQLLAARPALAYDLSDRAALHCAAQRGHKKVVAQLVAHSPEMINVKDSYGRTALAFAVDDDCHEVTAYLLAQGATGVDAKMLWAVLDEDKEEISDEVVKLILDREPKLIRSGSDHNHNTVLHFVFGPRNRRGALFSEELMLKCWQLHPEALYSTNCRLETPFIVAVRNDNKFATELVHAKLPFDEIVRVFDQCNKPCPREILGRLHECLSGSLNKDLIEEVYDYSIGPGKTLNTEPEA